MSSLPELLDADDLAKRLRSSRRQVYRWVAEHDMPCIRIGRTMLFDTAEVTAWLNTHSTTPTASDDGGQEQQAACETTKAPLLDAPDKSPLSIAL